MALSERTQRMIDSAPTYYQYSQVYESVQNAIGSDLDLAEKTNEDIRDQLYIHTATWGLKYWEVTLGLYVNESDSYPIRRSRVLSKWRGFGNFSSSLIKTVAESYANGEVAVSIDVPNYEITIKFVGPLGVPPNLDDLKAAIENIVHAHIGTSYAFRYLTVGEVDNLTIDEMQARKLTDFAPFAEIYE